MTVGQRTILVVEDDEDIRSALEATLAEEGYEVVSVASGTEAIQVLSDGPSPGLVLLDLFMPSGDGRSVLEEVDREPRLHDVPVVLMTAATRSIAQEVAGAREVLLKPFEVDKLFAVVARHIGAEGAEHAAAC